MGYPTFGKTIPELTAEIRANNIQKGFRPAEGGPGNNTFGDYIALAHSELSEALEAYRDHRLEDATRPSCGAHAATGTPCLQHGPAKPEGVGSELADTLIRLLDMADVFGIDLEREVARKIAYNATRPYQHGGRTVDAAKTPVTRLTVAAGNGRATRYNALWMAIPTDPRDWWTGEEIDHFLVQWARFDLPKMTMTDGQGETIVFWCADVRRAAQLLGMNTFVNDGAEHFTITKGAYTASIVQAEEKKETKDA